MKILVCSGFSPSGLVQYGERFLSSFDKFWPAEIGLSVWAEEPFEDARGSYRDLWKAPGADAVLAHVADDAAHGAAPGPLWKDKERRAGYSFRWDAAKFWKQCLIPHAALREVQTGDILVWLDADVETIAPVPADLIPRLLGEHEVAYLGRTGKHSEIGFWAVRINSRTRHFLSRLAATYWTGAFRELREWHSAFVWDHCRRADRLDGIDLTPGGSGHVWPSSPLAPYMRHDKGKRKPGGRA